jgi:hypothetical protein
MKRNSLGFWIAIGIAIGCGYGVAARNIPLGVGFGVAVGVLIWAVTSRRAKG